LASARRDGRDKFPENHEISLPDEKYYSRLFSSVRSGASEGNSCFFALNLNSAAVDVMRGLWIPLGDYGVLPIGASVDDQAVSSPPNSQFG
jgi:hypothetical protein